MEDVEELVNKICEKNNYDELLLEIVKKGKESNTFGSFSLRDF